MASMTRPQLGSPPHQAHLTSTELATASAALRASWNVAAPLTRTSTNRLVPLPVFDDELRQLARDMIERRLEPFEIRRPSRQTLSPHRPVSEEDHRVVGAHVAIDRDPVEALFDGDDQCALQFPFFDGRVGAHHAQHGSHIGIDHPRSFSHPANPHNPSIGQRHLNGVLFWKCVGGHDCPRRGLAASRQQGRGCPGNPFFNGLDGKRDADPAGGADQYLPFPQAQRPADGARHSFGMFDAGESRAGVRVAAVEHDRAQVGGAQVRGTNLHRRSLDFIRCENCRTDRGLFRADQG